MTTLAENLVILRKRKGLKQWQVAQLLYVAESAYNRYEKGKSEPDVTRLALLADFYNITLDELIGREFTKEQFTMRKRGKTKPALSENLRQLRKSHHLRQEDMAKLLLLKKPAYNKYENDRLEPSIGKLIQLADFFQLPLDDLVYQTIH